MFKSLLDIETLSVKTRLPISTIRHYISRFEEAFEVKKRVGRRQFYDVSAAKVLKKIRKGYESGKNRQEIAKKLGVEVKNQASSNKTSKAKETLMSLNLQIQQSQYQLAELSQQLEEAILH